MDPATLAKLQAIVKGFHTTKYVNVSPVAFFKHW
jgi:hypothetical protein